MPDGSIRIDGQMVRTVSPDGGLQMLGVGFSGSERAALAEAISGGAFGMWTQVGNHFYDNTISSATDLTPEPGATAIVIQAEAQNVYVTVNGQTPSATVGGVLTPEMGPVIIPLQGANVVKVLEAAASAAIRGWWIR